MGQPKVAKRMAKDIMRAGVFIGLANSCLATAVLWVGRPAFTNSAAVLGVTAALLPGLATALCVHTCSMASEGLLLAGASPFLEGVGPGVLRGSMLAFSHFEAHVCMCWSKCMNPGKLCSGGLYMFVRARYIATDARLSGPAWRR